MALFSGSEDISEELSSNAFVERDMGLLLTHVFSGKPRFSTNLFEERYLVGEVRFKYFGAARAPWYGLPSGDSDSLSLTLLSPTLLSAPG